MASAATQIVDAPNSKTSAATQADAPETQPEQKCEHNDNQGGDHGNRQRCNHCAMHTAFLSRDYLQEAKVKRRRNKENENSFQAENVTGYRGHESIYSILEFIEGDNHNSKSKSKKTTTLNTKKNGGLNDTSKQIKNENPDVVVATVAKTSEFDDKDSLTNASTLSERLLENEEFSEDEFESFIPVNRNKSSKNNSVSFLKNKLEKRSKNGKEPQKKKFEKNHQCSSPKPSNSLQSDKKSLQLNNCSTQKNVQKNSSNENCQHQTKKADDGDELVINDKNIQSASAFLKNRNNILANESNTGNPLAPIAHHCRTLASRNYDDLCAYSVLARQIDLFMYELNEYDNL